MQTSTEPLTHPFTFSTRKQNDCRSDVTTLPGMEEEEDAEEEGGWVGRTDWAESSLAPWSVSAPLLFSSSTPLFFNTQGLTFTRSPSPPFFFLWGSGVGSHSEEAGVGRETCKLTTLTQHSGQAHDEWLGWVELAWAG